MGSAVPAVRYSVVSDPSEDRRFAGSKSTAVAAVVAVVASGNAMCTNRIRTCRRWRSQVVHVARAAGLATPKNIHEDARGMKQVRILSPVTGCAS